MTEAQQAAQRLRTVCRWSCSVRTGHTSLLISSTGKRARSLQRPPDTAVFLSLTLSLSSVSVPGRDEEVRQRAVAELRRAVERDLLSLAPEDSTRLVDELTTRVFDLVNSAEAVEKLAGLSMLQQLLLLLQPLHSSQGSLALPLQQHETVIARCTQLFRILFQQLTSVTESRVLELAAATLGQLCRSAPTLTAETVHFHCRQALDWLSSAAERSDRRHLAAVYVLRELSAQTPSLFAAYAPQLLDSCWIGLKDARAETREVTVAVIANLLSDLSRRSPLTFANICEQLYEEARNVLQQHSHALSAGAAATAAASPSSLSVPSSPLVSGRQLPRSPQAKASPPSASKRAPAASLPAVHSALLLLHQLVQHSRPLMLQQLPRVFELVAKHRDSREMSIVRAELQLLPMLAALRPDAFLSSQADWVMEFVLAQATGGSGQQADAAMAALSQLMAIAGEGLAVYVDGIVAAVDAVLTAGVAGSGAGAVSGSAGLLGGKRKDRERDADRVRRVRRMTDAALDAIGVMSRHLPLSFCPFADHLLDCMLRCPLSASLISALTAIMQHLPQLSADIQLRLADTLVLVLSAPFMHEPTSNGDGQTAATTPAAALHGHGHSHSISSFSSLSSPFSSSAPVAAFFPLISPTAQLLSLPSVPAAIPLPVAAAGLEATKPTSPYSLPRHLQLHRLQPAASAAIDTPLVLLAFSTLSTFPFSFSTQFSLLALARFTMTRYMEEDGLQLRKEAALTTLHLVAAIAEAIAATFSSSASAASASSSPAASSALLGSQLSLVCYDVVRRIVVLAVTDSSLSIRSALLSALHAETRLDRFLVQPDLLSCVFLCLHDEYSDIRHAAILLLGRLAQKNPAHILPTLRITLLQLLNELQDDAVGVGAESSVRGGGEGRRGLSQEEGARMLGELIGSCHALIRPYVDSILGVLVPKLGGAEQVLRDGAGGGDALMAARRGRNETLIASVLSTLGKLSVICGDGMAEFLDHLLPLLLDSLYPPHISAAVHASAAAAAGTHAPPAAAATALPAAFAASAATPPASAALTVGSSSDRRQMTLRTLHLLLSSTSSVVGPFIKYPHFLPCLLHLIKTDRSRAVRLEATRLIGLVGAIDPLVYRRCQQDWQAVMGEREGGVGTGGSSLGAGGDGKLMRRAASEPSKSLAGAAATGSVKADKAPAAKEKAEAKEETKREDGDDGAAIAGGGSLGDAVARVGQQGGELMAADEDADGDGNGELYLCQSQAYDEYFPSVSLASLMRVVVDPQLLSFHTLALHALMFVLKTLGKEKCSPFLSAIVPAFLREIRAASDEALRVGYFRQLAAIVQLVGAGVKGWVDEMVEVSLAHWPLPAVVTGPSAPVAPLFTIAALSALSSFSTAAPPALLQPILQLFEQLSIHVAAQFQSHFPFVLSRFLSLFAEVPSEQNVASARAVLTSLAVFAAHCNLTAQLHLLLPSLLDLCEEQNDRAQPRSLQLRIDAVHAIAVISFHHDCSSQASRILQPFARIIAAAPTAAQAAPSPTALTSAASLVPSGSSSGPASSPHSVSSSPVLRPSLAGTSVHSLLFRETLGAVCSLIAQMSFAFLLFEPLITRAVRERERTADRTAHAVGLNGAATLTAPVDGRGGAGALGAAKAGTLGRDGERERERDTGWREREAEQVSRYFRMVEQLKGRLDEVRERARREREGRGGSRTDEDEEWDREREREREKARDKEKEREKERERRTKDRRSTMGRMTTGAERDRERARGREQTASLSSERERERHTGTGRDSLSSFHLIAAASALPLDGLDGWKAVAPSLFLSPNSSPATGPSSPPEVDGMPPLLLSMNQSTLARSFSSSHQSTSEDWLTWLRALQLELLRESPSFALRACSALASKYPPLARELLCDAFVSCWREMDDAVRDQVIDSLDSLLTASIQPHSSVPPDVVLCVLSVADHCQHHDQPLPLSHRRLGAAAERCSAHARALYHYECLFRYEPSAACIESLIAVNTKLQLSAAAAGVLQFAMRHEPEGIKPMWFERLHRWDEALSAYERRQLVTAQQQQPDSRSHELLLGRLRCLKELQQWERLAALASTAFLSTDDSAVRGLIAPLVSAAVHQLRCWELLEPYLPYLAPASFDGCFYRALYSLHAADASPAQQQQIIDRAGEAVEAQLSGLTVDSYGRAYGSIVRLQQCAEMSEVIAYKSGSEERRVAIRRLWAARLQGAQRSVGVWSETLGVRALVMSPKDDVALWLDYAKLARKSGKLTLSLKILTALMGFDPTLLVTARPPAALPAAQPQLTFASLKHLYAVGYHRSAYSRLSELVNSDALQVEEGGTSSGGLSKQDVDRFKAKCYLKLGGWQLELMDGLPAAAYSDSAQAQHLTHPPLLAASSLGSPGSLRSPVAQSAWRREEELNAGRHAAYNAILPQVLNFFHAATVYDPGSAKAWHQLSMSHFMAVQRNKRGAAQQQQPLQQPGAASHRGSVDASKRGSIVSLAAGGGSGNGSRAAGSPATSASGVDIHHHIVPAISGFFRSILLHRWSESSRQDVLRVLQLWFEYGWRKEVEAAMISGINGISIDTWLAVIPQMIARLHTPHPSIRFLLHELLSKIGRSHPQALVYPLTVASKSQSDTRRASSLHVLATIRQHSALLVSQAGTVSSELVRVAILWHELWHEAIEEASRLWFGQHNAEACIATLQPLHELMAKGASTAHEQRFLQQFGAELTAAASYCSRFTQTQSVQFLTRAWEIYSSVFRQISKAMASQQPLQLAEVSPRLLNASDLQLAVPGSYRSGAPVVRIGFFSPVLRVIESKQHPRRLSISGSDGREYRFLLKGHEDLRQDERVMQLFGLVNTFLSLDRSTAKLELQISRYAVVPLSPNSGLIQWLPSCDTLHALIRQYRDAKRIELNIEQRLMLRMAPDYQLLSGLHKVEVFQHALLSTSDFDLARTLHIRARSAELWLEHRQRFTRSLAVMSIVGYVLGLGDRHPCNLMLERASGSIVHIDFGDCFEVAMSRDKYPERVPFRLTRMLVAAMDSCGSIDGSFIATCTLSLAMMRKNRNSVMALLEAFVYDPLINWRLLTDHKQPAADTADSTQPTSPISPLSPQHQQPALAPAAAPAAGGRRPSAVSSRRPSALSGLASSVSGVEVGTNPLTRDRRRSIIAVAEESERERRLDEGRGGEEDEELNEKAVAVIARIGRKLKGTDFDGVEDSSAAAAGAAGKEGQRGQREAAAGGSRVEESEGGAQQALDVQSQVERLIREATEHRNLCQAYIGWCPFW